VTGGRMMQAPGTRLGRVLCVTSNFPRWEGDSTTPFVLHLAQDLQTLGWDVDVLAPHAPGAARRELLGGLTVNRFRYLLPESAQTVCYQGGALINLRKHPLNRLKLPALVGAETVAVARRLLAQRYDVIHAHWILPQGFTAMLAQRVRRTPWVVTVHGGDIFGLPGRWMAAAKRAALKNASAVTVNSSCTERAVLDLVPALKRPHRIPMGVATDALTEPQHQAAVEIRRRHRRGQGPLLVFLGRLVDEKGVEDLLRAVALLRDRLPDTTALIVGDGQDRVDLEHCAAALGIRDRLTFTGWIDSGAVPAYLAAADAFIGPSRRAANGWVEAQGLTLIEAMSTGVPVIATRLGGVPDAVIHERTGLLVDERSPEQIADAVCRLQSNSALAPALTSRARAHVVRNFSRDASAAAFSDLFSSLKADAQCRPS
jgi:phosphatidyl-myo-inositol dimannoside synthase